MVESDEEQLEQLKNWWDENGTSLMVTIVVVLGSIFGFRAWEASVQQAGENASVAYENLVQATDNLTVDDTAMQATAAALSNTLREAHASSTYSVFAALQMAKLAVEADDLPAAQTELEWALSEVDDPALEAIVRVRLARVLLAQNDATAAMALVINFEAPPGQVASVEEARGDVYHALGDLENARASYQLAVQNLGEGVEKPILEIKLADIPLGTQIAAPQQSEDPVVETQGPLEGETASEGNDA